MNVMFWNIDGNARISQFCVDYSQSCQLTHQFGIWIIVNYSINSDLPGTIRSLLSASDIIISNKAARLSVNLIFYDNIILYQSLRIDKHANGVFNSHSQGLIFSIGRSSTISGNCNIFGKSCSTEQYQKRSHH